MLGLPKDQAVLLCVAGTMQLVLGVLPSRAGYVDFARGWMDACSRKEKRGEYIRPALPSESLSVTMGTPPIKKGPIQGDLIGR